jgi:hypothetical protein
VGRHLEIRRAAAGVATLAVRLTAPNAPPVELTTRMPSGE